MDRSATTELDLEAGHYLVMVKITAWRDKSKKTPETVVKESCEIRPEKLMAVGLSYDLAHAKGHLRDSEVECKERLRNERRDKSKAKAKKDFEWRREVQKKEKLRRLRLEAKEKAKRGTGPQGDQNTDSGVQVSIRVSESILQPTKCQSADGAIGETKIVSQGGTGKHFKILVEATDKVESTKGGDQITAERIEKPMEGGDNQTRKTPSKPLRRLKTDTNARGGEKGDDIDAKNESATESAQEKRKARSTSTSSVSSAESWVTTEDDNKARGQSGVKSDEERIYEMERCHRY